MRLNMNSKKNYLGYLFILPFSLMFAIFKLYPMLYGVVLSFWDRNSEFHIYDTTFVGFENYIKVLTSSSFWESFMHSIVFSLVNVSVVMIAGFLLAILLDRAFAGRTVVRTFFYIPYVTNMIAVGVVFKYLLNPQRGPVNAIFRLMGMEGPKWLNSTTLALPTVAVIAAWVALAFNIITCLAALQDIPKDYYEVADLEGASRLEKLRYIVIPQIAPILFMLLTICLIRSFKNYATIAGLTGGGPGTATKVVSMLIYADAFSYMKFSIASAEGIIFATFIIILNRVLNKVRSIWERR